MKQWFLRITIFGMVVGLFSFKEVKNLVYLQVSTQRLHQNKVMSTRSEILVNCDNGDMTIHYLSPDEFYVFTNKLGEMEAYYPVRNEIVRQQNSMFSSENDPIYHFFNNQAQDLGLAGMGFALKTSQLEEHYLVSEWTAPVELMAQILGAKLVQEDYLPIFISYYGAENKVKQKIFFSDWNSESYAVFPQRITQIDYLPGNDTIISKKVYEQLKTGDDAEQSFHGITIPKDAKLVKFNSQ